MWRKLYVYYKKILILMFVLVNFLSWSIYALEAPMKIKITFDNDIVITATMNNSQAAKDFVAMLPLTLLLKDFNNTEKISDALPKRLTEDGKPFTPVAGDLAYYAPWGNLAVFYRNYKDSPGLYKLGSIDSGAEAFNVSGSVRITLEHFPANTSIRNTIFPKGERATADYFSGTVWLQYLVADPNKIFNTQVYNVTFDPSARTHWHSHPGGQILLITDGTGYYQEKGKPAQFLKVGDVVTIPPNIIHWHGAAPESKFVHIGMSTKVDLGPAAWFGPVTDAEYKNATDN
jgi:quercetin dioxygenase-like cupin family protein